ncbi:MAG: 4Fe-4S binding protein [Oscillospiraceae bacterium]|nr:4Fe-4S binding protein [Oscillospiraceae bacterium]MBR6654495.1 4Fe-4S binding protein [Oscillospiraceae bacterium]
MKKVKVTDHSKCYACFQCMVACSTAFYKEFDQDKSCIRIGNKKDGRIMVKACSQCGKCAQACEQNAITQNAKGVYMIDKKLCIGCGKCVAACPFEVMVQVGDKVSKCIACGKCVRECPMDVLELVEE